MRITTSDQLQQYRAEGRHFTLNRQGQLETQSSFMHLLEKIGDAFRSLTSSGRAAIEQRQAALQAAMDDVLLRGTVINAARTPLPRNTGSSSPSGARNSSSAQAPHSSAGVGISEKEEREAEEIRTAAEALLRGRFPRKSGEERQELLRYVCEEMQAFMPGMREDLDRNPGMLKQTVTDFVNALSGDEKPALPPETTPRSAALHRTRTLTGKDIRPDTLLLQGQNTCFMISVLNSMMTSERGRRILAGSLGSDGRMTVGGQSFHSPYETNGSFSPLEHSLGAAYQVHGADEDPGWREGGLGDALIVARMFGMKLQSQDRVGDWSPELIRSFLDAGQMVLLYSGVHYTAVVGVEGDRLIVRNSLHSGTEEYVDVNAIRDSRLQVFEYPDE